MLLKCFAEKGNWRPLEEYQNEEKDYAVELIQTNVNAKLEPQWILKKLSKIIANHNSYYANVER